jgi:DNA repair exonuclease SbcCD ATPase subunit
MAAPVPEPSVWTILWPVIVGGLIGIAGSFFGTLLLERAKEKKEKKKKRAEKLEELVSAVHEFDHWLDHFKDVTAYRKRRPVGLSPLSKLEGIAGVYFPDFLEQISKLRSAASSYQYAISGLGQKRLADKTSEINDRLVDAYMPYLKERNELLDNLKQFARKEVS